MKQQTINNILQFLARTQLQGSEVIAFNECVKELQELTKPKIEEVPKEIKVEE